MAGTADDLTTPEWLLLSAARIYVIGFARSQATAERLIVNHLRGEWDSFAPLRRRYAECVGYRGELEPVPSSGQFWCEYPHVGITVDIDWQASTARRRVPGETDCTLHFVQVHRADLDAILRAIGLMAPAQPSEPAPPPPPPPPPPQPVRLSPSRRPLRPSPPPALGAKDLSARRDPSPSKPSLLTCERFIEDAVRNYPQRSNESELEYKKRLFQHAGGQWKWRTFRNRWSEYRKKS
jgi:hypothetical protein